MAALRKAKNTNQSCEEEAMPLPDLPIDVVAQILSKLPVKTLLQFRCVSKSWLFLISSTHFAKAHLNQSLTNPNIRRQQTLIYTRTPGDCLYTIDLLTSDNEDKTMVEVDINYIFGNKHHTGLIIIGSCNGLVCITSQLRYLYIFNISTRESKEIPPLVINSQYRGIYFTYCLYGFGYDHTIDDYKLVRVDSNNVHVYSLRSDSWKVVQGFPYSGGFIIPRSCSGRLLNGAIHWICLNKDRKQPFMVAAFDLVEEKFREVPTPAPLTYGILEVIEGCLCIRKFESNNEFWIMKEYGLKQSWTKFGITIPFYHEIKLLPLLKNDEVLFLKDSQALVLYNTRERTHRDLRFQDIQHGLIHLCQPQIFVESLISPSLKCEPEPI